MNEELRVIITAEIEDLKKQIADAKKEVEKFAKQGNKSFKEFNDAVQKVGDKSKAVLKVAAGAVAGLATALLSLGPATKDYREGQAKLVSAFEAAGSSADTAKQTYNDLYRVLGDSDTAVEAANHLAKLTTNQKDLKEWTNITQGVFATFGDSLPIESLTEAVNHTAQLGEVQGSLADALEWSGVNVDEFNEQLFWCNSESEREKLIRDTLNGIYSEAGARYEENAASVIAQNEAQEKLNGAMATLAEVTAPIMTMLTELGAEILADLTPYLEEFASKYLPDIQDSLSGVGKAIGKVITWIADNWELVSTLAAIILGIAAAVTVFSTAMGVVNAVMYASPVTWIVMGIVAALAALVAGTVLVIKHWDEIKAATKKAWDAVVNAINIAIDWIVNLFKKIINWVKENWQGLLLLIVNPFAGAFKLVYDNCDGFRTFIDNFIAKIKAGIQKGFNWIKEKIVSPIKEAFNTVRDTFNRIPEVFNNALNKAKNVVSTAINKIKGFFNFNWSLPKIKTPKIEITWSQSPGWMAEAAKLVGLKGVPKFGVTWNARGGVFDKPTLFNYGGSLQGIGENGAEAVVPLENNTEWLDKIANRLADSLGGNSKPIILQVDGTTFAKTSIDSINKLTRQQGKLTLNLV